ncbi:MAG: hypothetical protein WBC04_02380 [Candidatus Acidiferrales bacterium]
MILPPTYQVLVTTRTVTGFCRMELLGLFGHDVDWVNGLIRIRRSLQPIPKKLLGGCSFHNNFRPFAVLYIPKGFDGSNVPTLGRDSQQKRMPADETILT